MFLKTLRSSLERCSLDLSRAPVRRGRRRPVSVPRSVLLAAFLTALMGVVNLLSVTTPALRERVALLQQVLPLEVRFGSHLAAALSGFALLVLARGLARRKQAAWLLTVAVLAVSTISHLLKGLDYEEAALSAGLALWLARLRFCFLARSDRPSVRRALWVLAAAAGFSFAYGVLGLALLDRHFSVNFDAAQAARQVVTLWTQFDGSGILPVTPFGRYFADSLSVVAALTIGYALLAVVRPVLVRAPASQSERARARAIVETWGRTSLAHFALSDDKSYFFSDGGSLVAYALRRRVCLALGDPIGPPEDAGDALKAFCGFCARNDWQPAFVCTEPDTVPLFHAAGLDVLCFGHEAIVPLHDWTLAGGRMKDVRGRVNRLRKFGYETRLHAPPLCPQFAGELGRVNDEWLYMTGSSETGFSMGTFDGVERCSVMAVHGPDSAVVAFANLYPEYAKNEATVDMMRRRASAENGTMELLLASLFDWAKEQGYDTFNLGLSPLAGVGEKAEDSAGERALHHIFSHSRQFYNFEGLHRFKAKFHPHWSPRFLVYPGASSLPAVALAVICAHAGDDFLWRYLRAGRGTPAPPPTMAAGLPDAGRLLPE